MSEIIAKFSSICRVNLIYTFYFQVKIADVKTKDCRSLVGTGKPGTNKGNNLSDFELSEPGGLCVDQNTGLVYIADTNNHRIVVLDTQSQKISVVRGLLQCFMSCDM